MTTADHSNNFDAVRIAAALMVLVDHQFPLTGTVESFSIWHRSLGEIAVEIFFAVSGFLVAQSWQRDPHVLRFLAKRVLRIWPGLSVMLLLSVFVVGLSLTSLPAVSYLSDSRTWRYLVTNLAMHPSYLLPGVFHDNPYPAVNGSLWTLPYEVRWYLILLALGVLTVLRRTWLIALIWAVVYGNYFFVYGIDARIDSHGDHRYAAELGAFFLAGTVLHGLGPWWQRHRWRLACAAGLAALCLAWFGDYMAGAGLFVPCMILAIGTSSTPMVRRAGRFGDPSYGIYIYAFLVQQCVVAWSENRLGYFGALPISLCATVLLAYLSWHLVERPCMSLKGWFGRPPLRGGKLAASGSTASSTAR